MVLSMKRGSVWGGRLRRWLAVRTPTPGGHPIRGISYGRVADAGRAVPRRYSYPANVDVCEHEVTWYLLNRLGLECA